MDRFIEGIEPCAKKIIIEILKATLDIRLPF
jgi:hypothetical protein